MIGIIGYGMVGQALAKGFPNCQHIISDPKYNVTTFADICDADPEAIFICVPTPTDNTNYVVLLGLINAIEKRGYKGLVVVKSTILPQYLEGKDVLYNPEFLSRATAEQDFVNPPMVIIGGEPDKAMKLVELYQKYSIVNTPKTYVVDIKTAALVKYTMNSFYALKVTFMNGIYDAAQQVGADYNVIADILKEHPWMGTHHFQVPGPDGQRGFGGPCLPKDTEALAKAFNMPLLDKALELNTLYRL